MIYGYARISSMSSTEEAHTQLQQQISTLKSAGATVIYSEQHSATYSGDNTERRYYESHC